MFPKELERTSWNGNNDELGIYDKRGSTGNSYTRASFKPIEVNNIERGSFRRDTKILQNENLSTPINNRKNAAKICTPKGDNSILDMSIPSEMVNVEMKTSLLNLYKDFKNNIPCNTNQMNQLKKPAFSNFDIFPSNTNRGLLPPGTDPRMFEQNQGNLSKREALIRSATARNRNIDKKENIAYDKYQIPSAFIENPTQKSMVEKSP